MTISSPARLETCDEIILNFLDFRWIIHYIILSGMHGDLVAPADFKSVVRRFRLGWVRFPHVPAKKATDRHG